MRTSRRHRTTDKHVSIEVAKGRGQKRRSTGARWFARELLAWSDSHRRQFPWRRTRDPFRILVAEFLLQRSRSSTVAKVYPELFARWPTVRDLSRADVEEIRKVIAPLGLTSRSRVLLDLAAEIDRRGSVPRSSKALAELPGIGPYMAGATIAVAFGRPSPVVDSVSERVYRRFFALPTGGSAGDVGQLEHLVASVTPRVRSREWNWAVLDLAATRCTPRTPKCPGCPLQARCEFSRSQQ